MACVSDDTVALMELAPDTKRYNQKIRAVQRKMDRSKRATNPDNYNPDGTVKKGTRGKWHYSKTYLKNKRRLQTLNRQKSAYIKQSHEIQCNKLLESAKHFYVEQMSYKGLQRKAKKTERSSTPTEIPQKDGSTKTVYKYKRRKRFGRSMNDRSPSSFVAILKLKVAPLGGSVTTITTKDFKASQYNHITDTYEKIPLKQRFKNIGNATVQRDLYSAFLIRNTNSDLDHPDRERCLSQFDHFVTMQNELISSMQTNGISMKQCFGF
jgi:FtsP/CotA-like multicopper oxidase with cupredoxin domain